MARCPFGNFRQVSARHRDSASHAAHLHECPAEPRRPQAAATRTPGLIPIVALAALAALIIAPSACHTEPGSFPAHSAVKYMPANGARLPYVEQGLGTPVVFVHGAVSDLRTMAPQREAAASQYRAITYTQSYFGTEPWDKSGPKFGVQTHADDLGAFIRGLNAGPVHLVAWSYTGHIVLDVALKNHGLVKSAFVFEPAVPSYVSNPMQGRRRRTRRLLCSAAGRQCDPAKTHKSSVERCWHP